MSKTPISRKAEYKKAVRLNITLPPVLDGRKNELLLKFGISDFSSYVQARMRKDLGLDFA